MHLKRKNKNINMATATKTYSLLSNINLEVANVYLHCVLQYYNSLNTAFCFILTIICYKAMFCCRFKSKTKTYSLLSNITFEVANIYLHCVLLLQFTEHCILFHTYYNLLQSHVLLQIQIQNYVRILQ